jgi:hypothetical protein
MSEDPIDLVASVGDLDPVVETLRVFLHDSGAVRVVAVIDAENEPAIVDVGRLAPVEVTTNVGMVHLPHAIELDAEPLARPRVHQLPPFEVDADDATVIGTMGGVDMVADALKELAAAFGGNSVAMAQFPTSTPDLQLTVSARIGEPVIVAIGDDQFELPD